MLLGKKKKKGNCFQVDYIVSVLEIKPWPPSVALCSVQTVLIQWENGELNSGFLPPGVPSLNGFEDGKIEFNEFFKLPVTLTSKDNYNNHNHGFQKNNLEFHLYEPKKDKAVKGQLLGTAVINLAEFGIIRDVQAMTAPIVITKKVSKGANALPLLYVQIQPFDNEGIESVLRMMSEQGDDNESEPASVTDDDGYVSAISRTSSFRAGNSSSRMDEMLNFVNVGLNSELGCAAELHDNDEGRTRSLIEKKEYAHSGEDDWAYGRKSLESNTNVFGKFSEVATTRKQTSRSISTLKFGKKGLDLQGFGDKLKHIKSIRLPTDSPRSNGPPIPLHLFDREKEESSVKEVQVDTKSQGKSDKKEKKNVKPDNRPELESKIKMLEEELREAAALEIGLYSVIAEHLNSKRKVHAPARRLARFYRHVCRMESQTNRASSARTIVSGVVMVSKACGNDVTRLTFWLSNTIILRSMVSQVTEDIPSLPEPIRTDTKSGRKKSEKKSSSNDSIDSLGDWEDPHTFIMALEKVEAWIFFRIVEGIWWQSFIPHMQPAKKKKKGKRLTSRKTQRWKFGLGDQEQGNFSIELWKKAFHDACERLCPIRAGGHDCGCLPMLSKMVMEHLVDRLDVAMFNAILRDSEEMPTDPMSDPITELKVLPIPAGKSSFGAGAQLKNAVGSWSKWLSDYFGLEEDHPSKDQDESNEEDAIKAFHLLNALGDLMRLPLGMLADATTRKEVCPIFGGTLLKRVFTNFEPDDFSPDPISVEVLEAFVSEDPHETTNDYIISFPCAAKPVEYSPLPAALFSSLLGETQKRSGSSLLRKAHNSDDELDKLSGTTSFDQCSEHLH
ncbi:uncharacterized protein LOC110710633 [Chenopodium quinoa]|uniref:C2 NT-type domain-containing protein n=1 Tax=Chenopodium quinoa TaxID=63459 RepID=A0A803L149_CHEQI|nr:uncharacterized protein LOC110710633 [Chenopodium quinoa]